MVFNAQLSWSGLQGLQRQDSANPLLQVLLTRAKQMGVFHKDMEASLPMEKGLELDDLKVLSNPNHARIL